MKNPLHHTLGQTIAAARKKAGFTQERLAAKVNLNTRSLQRIEAGEDFPRYTTLFTIADALSITPDQLIMPMWDYWHANMRPTDLDHH